MVGHVETNYEKAEASQKSEAVQENKYFMGARSDPTRDSNGELLLVQDQVPYLSFGSCLRLEYQQLGC